ncbi:hypothetical protein [Rummeliibacillus pycnus]|nr:hypothetical protein [Rummeliibacillus pycnus]
MKINFSSLLDAEATIDELQLYAHTKMHFILSKVETVKNYLNL